LASIPHSLISGFRTILASHLVSYSSFLTLPHLSNRYKENFSQQTFSILYYVFLAFFSQLCYFSAKGDKGENRMGFNWHAACETHWNKMSAHWQANSEEMWETGSRKTILPVLTRYIQPDKGRVLDAGCGDGYGSAKLAELGFQVTGLDISEEMIKKAETRIKPGLALSFVKADLRKLPFPEHSFQAIMAINVLEWTDDPREMLTELKRYLQPGGLLALGILGPTAAPREHGYRRLYGEDVVINTMMPWECGRLLTENGYEIVHQEGVYKRGVTLEMTEALSLELCQALSFLWMFYARPVNARQTTK
jgi:ubiquinone/menaquinone biosynthesis C-methylase UbiE